MYFTIRIVRGAHIYIYLIYGDRDEKGKAIEIADSGMVEYFLRLPNDGVNDIQPWYYIHQEPNDTIALMAREEILHQEKRRIGDSIVQGSLRPKGLNVPDDMRERLINSLVFSHSKTPLEQAVEFCTDELTYWTYIKQLLEEMDDIE